jgi:thiol-disulfide isomerase/thioredoxin
VKRNLPLIFITLFALLSPNAALASSGAVASCSSITTNKTITKGISLPCLDNKSKVLYQSIKGPVVVNVFGSWCEPCNQEIPHFLDLQALHKVAIIGIDVEERNMQAGRDFVLKKKMTWPILFDVTSVTRGIFGLGVPVTWFIDAHGKVVYKQIGLITSTAQLKSEVTKYLKVKL